MKADGQVVKYGFDYRTLEIVHILPQNRRWVSWAYKYTALCGEKVYAYAGTKGVEAALSGKKHNSSLCMGCQVSEKPSEDADLL